MPTELSTLFLSLNKIKIRRHHAVDMVLAHLVAVIVSLMKAVETLAEIVAIITIVTGEYILDE